MVDRNAEIRPEKLAVVSEIRERIAASNCAMLIDFKGMTVDMSSDIRAQLREQNARMFICKNRLIGEAMKGEPFSDVWSESLSGSSALVTGAGDAVAIAKLLDGICKKSDAVQVKCAMLDGLGLNAEEFNHLAALPSKLELQAKLVGTLAAPMRNLASVLSQKTASIIYVLKAIQDKKEAA